MKKFVLLNVLILILIISVFFIIELLLSLTPNQWKQANDYLDKNSNNLEVLILGNSYSHFGVNPDYIELGSYNAAHPSKHHYYDFLTYNKYETNFDSLKVVVMPASYNKMVNDSLGIQFNYSYFGAHNYVIDYGIEEFSSFKHKFRVLNIPPKSATKSIIKFIANKNTTSVSNLGWGNTYKSTKIFYPKKTYKYNADFVLSNSIFSFKKKEIINFTKNLRNKGVKIIYFTPPFCEGYLSSINFEVKNKVTDFFIDLEFKFDNVVFIDFNKNSIFKYEDFWDDTHLNEIGASKLTKLLNTKINLHQNETSKP